MYDNERSLRIEASKMSVSELYEALSWQKTLAEHADENFLFTEYDTAKANVKIIKKELRRRGC